MQPIERTGNANQKATGSNPKRIWVTFIKDSKEEPSWSPQNRCCDHLGLGGHFSDVGTQLQERDRRT
jgi:hypothetical protein